jgi:D-xylose transport system substrate-binding protein
MGALRRGIALSIAVATAALGLTACGDDSSGDGEKIALLLPESQTTRYEQHDYPLFKSKVKDLCDSCEVLYSNAQGDAATQRTQAEAALNNGAKVLVLDPVDAASAANIVSLAKAKSVPVISYDRLVANGDVDYYISFDNEEVGKLQASSLVDKLKADGVSSGTVVMINGDAAKDNNAKLFYNGANGVLSTSGFTIDPTTPYYTADWLPANAQTFMEGEITQLGRDGYVGVYAANDGIAGAAITAIKASGRTTVPPVTGQDAELAAIQRIVAGDQYMTVYKAFKPEADKAAEIAVKLAKGEKPSVDDTVNDGTKDVPSVLLTPTAVTVDNVKDTVIADGLYSVDDICTSAYASACSAAGIN